MAEKDIIDIAEELAKGQKSISITEFFEKNRHLLGFENKQKALLTCVKEALDNALDACEEQAYAQQKQGLKIDLPEIKVEVKQVSEDYEVIDGESLVGELSIYEKEVVFKYRGKNLSAKKTSIVKLENEGNKFTIDFSGDKILFSYNGKQLQLKRKSPRYRIVVSDNGPGIVESQIPFIFGKMLYGSKFHRMKQSRGQQGIGIHAAVLYGQLTTGKPVIVTSKIASKSKAVKMSIMIDILKNEPIVVSREEIVYEYSHGTRVELEVEGMYVTGEHGIDEYIRRTAIVNPHATIIYISPDGVEHKYTRVSTELPPEPKEIKPHPQGLELGTFMRILKDAPERTIVSALENEFSRVSRNVAEEVVNSVGIDPKIKPSELTREQCDSLLKALQSLDLLRPPTDCLSPIGAEYINRSLKSEFGPEFVYAVTRKPEVYRGIPFLVEAAVAYGGNIKNERAVLLRFANKIPLLLDASACAITTTFLSIDFARYGIKTDGKIPLGPLVFLVHIASVWVPYTSEGKTAIAKYPVIMEEIKLALQEVLRELSKYLSKQTRRRLLEERLSLFDKYSIELADSLAKLTSKDKDYVEKIIKDLLSSRREEIKKIVSENGTQSAE
jgi:DNA topoisomerase-6 subunit B